MGQSLCHSRSPDHDLVAQLAEVERGPDVDDQLRARCHFAVRRRHARENAHLLPGYHRPVGELAARQLVPRAAQTPEKQKQTQDEAEVAEAVDHERLHARRRLRRIRVPESNQQVAAQPHTLPTEEHDHEVVAHDEQQHRKDEQVEIGEEAPIGRFFSHVADGKNVDQRPDARDHQDHHHAQRIQGKGQVHVHGTGRKHGPQRVLQKALLARQAEHLGKGDTAHGKGKHHGRDRDAVIDRLAEPALQPPAAGRIDDRAQKRKERNQPQKADWDDSERAKVLEGVFHGSLRQPSSPHRGNLGRVDAPDHLVDGQNDGQSHSGLGGGQHNYE